ncbi:hypothetical protein OS189_04100 [Sulfitobacter sp. F26169L]|uniref:hypothetical protein n=1 Tax=Sulfitobacter sp. F26169L TaxID=2996015 RepID=UPI0022608CFD|nr:hypothetical protein [Sulfitobacter sp. F26169L]MCX7565525.1 hypothetical protein [Sulfitobacter sp. F26169L]
MIWSAYVVQVVRYHAWQNRNTLTAEPDAYFGLMHATLNDLFWAVTVRMSRWYSDA